MADVNFEFFLLLPICKNKKLNCDSHRKAAEIHLTKAKNFYLIHTEKIETIISGAIIGEGDRKSWDARGPMIWDNFSIFRTNCAILTSYIRANPRTCRGFSRGCCHVVGSNVESC